MNPQLSPNVAGPALRRFMRHWPGGIAVVTTAADAAAGQPAGCTVSAFISVSLRPPLVLISLAERSRTLGAIAERRVFCVNVLADSQRGLAARFAGAQSARFEGVPYHWEDGVPVLEGAAAVTLCEVDRVIEAADHVLVLAVPRWCRQDESAAPVVFYGGSYYTPLRRSVSLEATVWPTRPAPSGSAGPAS